MRGGHDHQNNEKHLYYIIKKLPFKTTQKWENFELFWLVTEVMTFLTGKGSKKKDNLNDLLFENLKINYNNNLIGRHTYGQIDF